MEKITTIKQTELETGFYLELNCCMCYKEVTLGGRTKKELADQIKEEGWRNINSDEYAVIGYWCGCEYI